MRRDTFVVVCLLTCVGLKYGSVLLSFISEARVVIVRSLVEGAFCAGADLRVSRQRKTKSNGSGQHRHMNSKET